MKLNYNSSYRVEQNYTPNSKHALFLSLLLFFSFTNPLHHYILSLLLYNHLATTIQPLSTVLGQLQLQFQLQLRSLAPLQISNILAATTCLPVSTCDSYFGHGAKANKLPLAWSGLDLPRIKPQPMRFT
jgi:hypothetical protein